MISSVRHVGVAVHSLDESIGFYRDLLGFSVDRVIENTELGIHFAFLSLGDHVVELFEYTDERAGQRRQWGPIDHLSFNVKDIHAAVAHCKSRGIAFHTDQPRHGPDGPFIFFEGPNGERIEFQEERGG